MEPHTFITGLGGLSNLQGLALVLSVFALLWYSTFRTQKKANSDNNKTLSEIYQKILDQYKNDLIKLSQEHNQAAKEMRQMYDNNSRLVGEVIAMNARYEKRGESLERLIQTNIQCWQQTIDAVKAKGYCPSSKEITT